MHKAHHFSIHGGELRKNDDKNETQAIRRK